MGLCSTHIVALQQLEYKINTDITSLLLPSPSLIAPYYEGREAIVFSPRVDPNVTRRIRSLGEIPLRYPTGIVDCWAYQIKRNHVLAPHLLEFVLWTEAGKEVDSLILSSYVGGFRQNKIILIRVER